MNEPVDSFHKSSLAEATPGEKVYADLQVYYKTLYRALGPQHWWPARTRFEVIVGAYLTQSTSWKNVESALKRLRSAGVLTVTGIREVRLTELHRLVRPAGYFRQKARRLKIFVAFLDRRYGGSLARMFAQPTERLRRELLGLEGVGPETADSILLYAGNHPIFVVDAYTRRILARHQLGAENAPYEEIRELWERALSTIARETSGLARLEKRNLKSDSRPPAHRSSPISAAKRSSVAQIYNEMHGLIVAVGKHHCLKSKPRCEQCPLQRFLPNPVGHPI